MSFDNLKAILEELADTRERLKADNARNDELTRVVKSAMAGIVKDTVVGNVMFSLKQQSGRTSYDTDAMQADGFDLTPYKKVGAPIMILSVKKINSLD